MAIRNIIQVGDETLRKKSVEVTEFDDKLHVLLDDMADTLRYADGAGLAAPQVGVLKRVFIVMMDDVIYEFINPRFIKTKGVQNGQEGCLSVKGKSGIVSRPMKVTLAYQDRFGEKHVIKAKGFFARAICHELDHLDGVLFKSKVDRMLSPDE